MCTGHLFGGHAVVVMLQELQSLFKQLVLGTVLFPGKEDSNDTQFAKIGSPINVLQLHIKAQSPPAELFYVQKCNFP